MKRQREPGCLACTRGTCERCLPSERPQQQQQQQQQWQLHPATTKQGHIDRRPPYDIDRALRGQQAAGAVGGRPGQADKEVWDVRRRSRQRQQQDVAATAVAPSPTLPKQVAIHFYPGENEQALSKYLVRHEYETGPEQAEADNEAAGLCWKGTLGELVQYVDPRFSPLVAQVRQALAHGDGMLTYEGMQVGRLDGEKECLHVWHRLSLAQESHSPRAVQAIVTLLGGAGDVARDYLLGEELVNAIHLGHSLGLRNHVQPTTPSDAELARLFPIPSSAAVAVQ